MNCAIMQPYLFPYIGYYQLVNLSDIFIIYDDVNFMKKSYINRNSIIVGEESYRFTLPVVGVSQHKIIKDLQFGEADKILKTIKQSYVRAPYFKNVIDMIELVLMSNNRNIAKVNELSIRVVFEYIGINKNIIFSSEIEYDRTLERSDKLVELTKKNACNCYINSSGGEKLYDIDYFRSNGVTLKFITSKVVEYKQKTEKFIPYLSIIDVLMYCSKNEIVDMLKNYELQ